VERFNLSDRDPTQEWSDHYARRRLREIFKILYPN